MACIGITLNCAWRPSSCSRFFSVALSEVRLLPEETSSNIPRARVSWTTACPMSRMLTLYCARTPVIAAVSPGASGPEKLIRTALVNDCDCMPGSQYSGRANGGARRAEFLQRLYLFKLDGAPGEI